MLFYIYLTNMERNEMIPSSVVCFVRISHHLIIALQYGRQDNGVHSSPVLVDQIYFVLVIHRLIVSQETDTTLH